MLEQHDKGENVYWLRPLNCHDEGDGRHWQLANLKNNEAAARRRRESIRDERAWLDGPWTPSWTPAAPDHRLRPGALPRLAKCQWSLQLSDSD
jgi:hypothetical protein